MEQLHYETGYCGSGVARSAWFGNKFALKILAGAEGRTELDSVNFPAPFPSGCAGLRAGGDGVASTSQPDRGVIGIPSCSGTRSRRVSRAATLIKSTIIR
jgi:hypothetical protein